MWRLRCGIGPEDSLAKAKDGISTARRWDLSTMKHVLNTVALSAFLLLFAGCGTSETTVIQPTETYELTDQEKENADREKEMAAERQQ